MQLRRLREARGISREAAGYEIRASESKISRMELGRVSFKRRDIEDLLTYYGVTGTERVEILELTQEANQPGWWHRYNDIMPHWFQSYVGFEQAASRIRTYEIQFVPGLLQTEEYARSVIGAAQGAGATDDVERRVAMRMRRQQLLTTTEGERLQLWAVIDEAALRRRIGNPSVMRGQAEHLIALSKRPNITIQVMPFRFGGHTAEGGAFSILRFPEADMTDIVYVEQLTSAQYLEKADEIERYTQVMDQLSVDSMTPRETVRTLDQYAKTLRELENREESAEAR
ncbi:helix-turn-helix domain-containing protein [Allonocardiopsis opalescens]|nr:helix-turn-helix transcriptional regulator [Allonocardiopsis opalescens]